MNRQFRLSAVLAALTLGAAGSTFAGEALDIELPSMRTPIENTTVVAPSMTLNAASGPLTRDEVRESLKTARAAGTLTLAGEVGDNNEALLSARENFNAAQTEVMLAEHQRGQERLALLEQESREEAQRQTLIAEMDDAYAVMNAMAVDSGTGLAVVDVVFFVYE